MILPSFYDNYFCFSFFLQLLNYFKPLSLFSMSEAIVTVAIIPMMEISVLILSHDYLRRSSRIDFYFLPSG